MDPIQDALSSMLSALQAAAEVAPGPVLPAPQLPALLALVGQDVNLLFLGSTADGQQLALPSGQVFSAQGSLAYPEGTQLLVRVLGGGADAGPLRLQTLEAQPPAPAAILAPLLQGEGASLQARLSQADPGPELAPLAALYQSLHEEAAAGTPAFPPGPAEPQPPAPGAQPAAPSTQAPAQAEPLAGAGPLPGAETPALVLPTPARIEAALRQLPAPAAAALRAALAPEPEVSTAEALATWITEAAAKPPVQKLPVADLLMRFQAALDRHPEAPAATLATFVKALVSAAPDRPVPPAPAPRPALLEPALAQGLRPAAGPGLPETWETWVRAAVKTLADPATAPREAPFHAAQAKEGTAFYELPLPWAPQSPLQVWVESDRQGQGRDPRGETRTVLVALKFTRLGETRLGIAKGPAGLQVRVWTEHPELLSAATGPMQAELQTLGSAVDLKVLPLHPGPGGYVPSLRSLVTGPTRHWLG